MGFGRNGHGKCPRRNTFEPGVVAGHRVCPAASGLVEQPQQFKSEINSGLNLTQAVNICPGVRRKPARNGVFSPIVSPAFFLHWLLESISVVALGHVRIWLGRTLHLQCLTLISATAACKHRCTIASLRFASHVVE